jgi:hypothetical protein
LRKKKALNASRHGNTEVNSGLSLKAAKPLEQCSAKILSVFNDELKFHGMPRQKVKQKIYAKQDGEDISISIEKHIARSPLAHSSIRDGLF